MDDKFKLIFLDATTVRFQRSTPNWAQLTFTLRAWEDMGRPTELKVSIYVK